ncbi:MAG: hypothetical protein H2172_16435 [Opitutus sp.]|nr:hypothetical protein [Opitutus sp.]MCS6274412.1 hypothetical protein [Opitutus sp.]MCS6299776.1 hypothetical protein [Opitutus sp.]
MNKAILVYFIACINVFGSDLFIPEPITIEVPKVVMKRPEGKAEGTVKHTIIGALYDSNQIVLTGVRAQEPEKAFLNPYALLDELVLHYKNKDFEALVNLFSPSSRPEMQLRLNHPERGDKIKAHLAGIKQFEIIASWIVVPNKLIVLAKSSPSGLPMPQLLVFEGGRWYMIAGEKITSDVSNSLGALYAAGRNNSEVKISQPSPEEILLLTSSGLAELADKLKPRINN